MHVLLIFKHTALETDLSFLEQNDLINLIHDAQSTSGVKVVLLAQ